MEWRKSQIYAQKIGGKKKVEEKLAKFFLVSWKDMLNWELIKKDMDEMKVDEEAKEKIKIVS